MTDADTTQALFGATDGLTSTIAVILATLIAGTRHSLIAGGFAIAVAASVGMAYAEWMSDHNASKRRALVMGAATLIASAAPVIPFLFLWRASGIAVSLGVCIALAVTIAMLRGARTPDSYQRAVATTIGGILVVSVLVSIPSLIVAS